MTDSPFGKTVICKLKSALGRASIVATVSCLGGLLAPPAQADTVIISTGGVALSTPGFFFSIGNPVVLYPPVVAYPPTIYFPAYPQFSYPHAYPVYSSSYRVHYYPSLAIDDALSPQVQPDRTVVVSTDSANPNRSPLTSSYVIRSGEGDPFAQFTRNTMPWLEIKDLSTVPGVDGVQAGSSFGQPEPEATTYQISSPDPFNQSLRSLGQ